MTRIAVIEKGKCNPLKCGNYLCIRLCPVNKTGGECIIESPDKKVEIMENTCTGCNICCKKCPFEAIHIINLPEKLKEDPIHRFSKNSFELFPGGLEKATKNFDGAWEWSLKYQFSSLADYGSNRKSSIVDKGLLGEIFKTPKEFKNFAKDTIGKYQV